MGAVDLVQRRSRRRAPLVVVLVALVVSLAACGDDDSGSTESPEEVLATAKESLDETSGVTLSLSTDELPEDVDGILEATGVATRAPAFDGNLTILFNGLNVDVPVVSVDGEVWAKLPFQTTYKRLIPADYGAPDPADFMDPDTGLSTWLTAVTDLEEGDQVRDGELVLTSYTGSLPGEVVDAFIPSAEADVEYPATFRIDDDGLLRAVEISGPFYGSDADIDYTVSVDDYGTDQDISKP